MKKIIPNTKEPACASRAGGLFQILAAWPCFRLEASADTFVTVMMVMTMMYADVHLFFKANCLDLTMSTGSCSGSGSGRPCEVAVVLLP